MHGQTTLKLFLFPSVVGPVSELAMLGHFIFFLQDMGSDISEHCVNVRDHSHKLPVLFWSY